MYDSIELRLKRKALGNQLAIAVGSSYSDSKFSLPQIAKSIIKKHNLDVLYDEDFGYWEKWNDFVNQAEKSVKRNELTTFVRELIANAEPNFSHRMIASIPISNFIDTTFDRSLYKALLSIRKQLILHDFGSPQIMGIWKQSNPENPNLFFMLPNVENEQFPPSIYEPTGRSKQNSIHLTNLSDMLRGKDLLLLDYSPHEAEYVLHLSSLVLSCEKVFNFTRKISDLEYWAALGVSVRESAPEDLIRKLVPYKPGSYSEWDDGFIAPTSVLDLVTRRKQFDCFISHFHGDREFVDKLERDLRLREILVWRDRNEIEIGDSISRKIEVGLAESYCFIIILSQEALNSSWVREELQAAYSRRIAGELKIFPVLYKECEIPVFLADYNRADFRDEHRYGEQIELLTQAIRNTVRRVLEKQ